MASSKTQLRTAATSGIERDSSIHHSLALKHAMRRLRALGGSRVLDLGPALGRNVQFLSPFISKLFIADFHESVRRQAGRFTFEGAKLERILERDLPRPTDGTMDLVLVWDLVDYLQPQQVEILGRQLARRCHRDSLTFLMLSTRPQVPERPSRYLILDSETLRSENDSRRLRQAPLYKEPDLDRLMPAFEVETSFLLRNGIQEYVLTIRSAA